VIVYIDKPHTTPNGAKSDGEGVDAGQENCKGSLEREREREREGD